MRFIIPMVVVGLGFFATASTASAQPPNTHALIHIHNESAVQATLYYRWGDAGEYKKFVEAKGTRAWFNFRYDGVQQKSPVFQVIFDADSDNGTKYIEYTLTRGASPDDNSTRYGHHYTIKQLQGTDSRYIAAITPGAVAKVVDLNAKKP